jgi:hypothetical protein
MFLMSAQDMDGPLVGLFEDDEKRSVPAFLRLCRYSKRRASRRTFSSRPVRKRERIAEQYSSRFATRTSRPDERSTRAGLGDAAFEDTEGLISTVRDLK